MLELQMIIYFDLFPRRTVYQIVEVCTLQSFLDYA